MLHIHPRGTNRIDVELTGKLDAAQMRSGLEELLDKAARVESGRMLYRIREFEMPSAGAIRVELGLLPQLLKAFRRFKRVAVVADQGWVRTIGEWEGHLFPGLEVKAFAPGDEAAAETWLAAE